MGGVKGVWTILTVKKLILNKKIERENNVVDKRIIN